MSLYVPKFMGEEGMASVLVIVNIFHSKGRAVKGAFIAQNPWCPLGPYRRPVPRALVWSEGVGGS